MHVQKTPLTDTTIKLTIAADRDLLDAVKARTLSTLKKDIKAPGFRAGKVPAAMVEKYLDPQALQSQFLDDALNQMYGEVLQQEKLRPVAQPKISVKKFVPFDTLEFDAEVEVIGEVTLGDYTNLSVAKKAVNVTDDDVNEVIQNLRQRMAEKTAVDRAAKDGDEVTIDFSGRDAKTGDPIDGADGSAYPLVLGSQAFIPGFEANLTGIKAGEDREFEITFPADYGAAALQNRKVVFTVTATVVNQVTLPDANDEFAAKAGPFKTLEALKADIIKQLTAERTTQIEREFESDVLGSLAEKSAVAIPAALIDEELTRLENEERQNVVYQGQTWEEHLAIEGVTSEEHRAKNRPAAELRVKAGLVLAEVADREKIDVTPEELEIRIKLLKGQYADAAMQSELDKPENRRELASRLLSEKTIAKLTSMVKVTKPKAEVTKAETAKATKSAKTTRSKAA